MENLENKKYIRAKKKVDAIRGFYGHLTGYCIAIPILAYINYMTTSFPWVIFPVLGWGFGLLMHGLEAHGYNPLLGRGWEERKIREYMENDRT
ncbi:MAG: 2TM domain-containing protein [Saonia sp.]